MMNPAPNCNHHEPTEDDCEICGFMKPGFPEDEENMDRNSRGLPGIAEGGGGGIYNRTFRQQGPRRYESQARSLNAEDLGSQWIKDEIKRLFPETRNPGKFACLISRIMGNSCCTESGDWQNR